MTNTRLMIATAAILIAGLLTADGGVMGSSATHPEVSPPATDPGQEAGQAAPAPRAAPTPPRPADTKPAAAQGPLVIQADVVDAEGHRLAGADVAATVGYTRGPEGQESILERTRTDGEGHARIEVARERPGALVSYASVWAYLPGRGIATSTFRLAGTGPSPPAIRLTLDQPAKWTITVLGPDDRPIGGLRLGPYSVRKVSTPSQWSNLPDAWSDRLTTTTDAQGMARLTYLPADLVLLAVRITGPGYVSHLFPFEPPRGKDLVLKLGRPGRVVGIVRTASGEPLADVSVDVWMQGSGAVPDAVGHRRITPDAILPLDPRPMKTGPQGAFQTPAALPAGSSYRVSIRRDGFVPFVSDWVKLDGERATIPDIRLQPLQAVTGQVQDRQGRPVAGARVFVPAGGPATTTDVGGRFRLAGILPGKAVILAEQAGFRLQGWLVDPLTRAEVGPLILVRASEAPGPVMKPMADPIPPEESRALADRLLEVYLPADPEKSDDRARLAAIGILSKFDPARALELLQDHKFRDEDLTYHSIRALVAADLAESDPERAEALAGSIPVPLVRAEALVGVAKALPAAERGRKRGLLERAADLPKDARQARNPTKPLEIVSTIAGQWLDLGERERARLVLEEGKTLFDPRPSGYTAIVTDFLGQLARLEPDESLARLRKLPRPDPASGFYDAPATVAVQLATDYPAKAEQTFNMWERTAYHYASHSHAMRLCRRLARVDPPRARHFAASQRGPAERAMAWAYVALGLAESTKDRSEVSEAIDHSIREIDRLRETGPGPEMVIILGDTRLMYPTNPAALILPVVERAAPERLAEVFWRAVALHPRVESDREAQLHFSYIGFECTLLARYDRDVAAVLFRPMDDYLRSLAARKSPQDEFHSLAVVAKGCIDPRAAVLLMESFTPPREFARYNPVHHARLSLAEALGLPPGKRWKQLCRSMGGQIPLDD